MQIIGAGFGRTGTLSLKHALEQLGYAPCYHMEDVLHHPHHARLWHDAYDGRPDWQRLLGGYRAGVDFPLALYYQELMHVYPLAKVILTLRDPDRWYESARATIYDLSQAPYWAEWLPGVGAVLRLSRRTIWNGYFAGCFEDRAYAIAKFERHNQQVVETVPADRLLTFDVKQGWAPLCRFLDKPIPDTPFPHLNDRLTMQRRARMLRLTSWGLPLLAVAAVAALRQRHSAQKTTRP